MMKRLQEVWHVWMTGEQDSGLKPLLSLLDNYGIKYDQGWIERTCLFPENRSCMKIGGSANRWAWICSS